MYIFLDEAGDLGFDLSKKATSNHIVITLLTCNSTTDFRRIINAAKYTLTRKVNYKTKKPKHELKGINTTLKTKKYFLRLLNNHADYKIYASILKKQVIDITSFSDNISKHRIYNKLAYSILKQVNFSHDTKFVNLIVDKSKRGQDMVDFNNYIKLHLESLLPIQTPITIDHKESQYDHALQAVDLFAYGIFRKYESEDTTWYDLFKDNIVFEDFFQV